MNQDNKPNAGAPVDTPPAEQKPKKKEYQPFVAPEINRKFSIAVIAVFIAMLLLPTIVWGALLALNSVNPAIMDTVDFDTGENRAFAEFPKDFDPQTFTSQVESWYNDHLPFRSVLYKTQETLDNALEKPYQETLRPALIKLFHGDSGNQGNIPAGDETAIKDIFNETEIDISVETETLPQFVPDEDEPTSCSHTYDNVSVTVTEPTCTEYGIVGNTCTQCGVVGTRLYFRRARKNGLRYQVYRDSDLLRLRRQQYL